MNCVLRSCTAVLMGALVALNSLVAVAQEPQFSTGLEFAETDAYEQFPKASKYRAVLPDRVDLSSRLPQPGDQGNQGSCTAWAVAYGARSYYDGLVQGQALEPRLAFSPAYIYNQIRASSSDCSAGSNIEKALNLLKTQLN